MSDAGKGRAFYGEDEEVAGGGGGDPGRQPETQVARVLALPESLPLLQPHPEHCVLRNILPASPQPGYFPGPKR